MDYLLFLQVPETRALMVHDLCLQAAGERTFMDLHALFMDQETQQKNKLHSVFMSRCYLKQQEIFCYMTFFPPRMIKTTCVSRNENGFSIKMLLLKS